ncbi:hypothetical protein [Nostoc sp.]|uniref:hypothetical protein n=1 Tax=Nostoc sp. TaxID=1180 RepID=UPI003FA5BD9F
MAIATQPQLTLDEFLKLPETEPASDFINGEIIQQGSFTDLANQPGLFAQLMLRQIL